MASLKEIKTRMASVQSTRKITSAMKMVASSKLHHAQNAIENMLPYEAMLEHILKTFLVSTPNTNTQFDVQRPVKHVALLVFSSSSSLCGGFNANVIKLLMQVVDEYHSKGLTNEDIVIYPIGRKVAEAAKKRGLTCVCPYPELAEKPNAEDCREIAKEVGQKWLKGEFDKVEMIYHHFKSAGSQILTRKVFLPIDLTEELNADKERDLTSTLTSKEAQEYMKKKGMTAQKKNDSSTVTPLNDDFIVEPDLHTVLQTLVPKLLHLMVYTALLDSNASEHAARMVAMQTATDNADELLKELSLQYNKSRQAAITSELLDIVGGTVNN